MKEEWKTIPSYPRYEVSSFGRVRMKAFKDETGKKFDKKFVSKTQNKNGVFVRLLGSNGKKTCYVKRLVAEAFYTDEFDELDYVRNKDGNPNNNKQENILIEKIDWGKQKKDEKIKTIIKGLSGLKVDDLKNIINFLEKDNKNKLTTDDIRQALSNVELSIYKLEGLDTGNRKLTIE